ncbi:hypothetical protein FOB84_21200 [Gordonia bronchialis]|uniref:hypothetical protein n=1 Tax=Gordonia bronchialis TaxID=2054 RepID=UPI00019B88E9|nr:hypothetical protein [Gordonia bronchialis]MCC3322629.1 hypothetical protein [Gordonia bronchialis]QGS27230.1 hypothetical protein FOB84_21200 [Gordonia bronchialis]
MTVTAAEALITRAWDVAEAHRLTGSHALVQAIWTLEYALDHNTTDTGHAAARVETLIGELP